jgi:hypothetical protein
MVWMLYAVLPCDPFLFRTVISEGQASAWPRTNVLLPLEVALNPDNQSGLEIFRLNHFI